MPDPHRDGDELPRAYVVRRTKNDDNQNPSEAEIRAYMKERLIYYKQPEGGIKFVEAIPKNASGKILKRLLREWAAEEMREEKREKKGARL